MFKDNRKVLMYLVNAETGEQERELRSGDVVIVDKQSSCSEPIDSKEKHTESSVSHKFDSFVKFNNLCLPYFYTLKLSSIEFCILFFLSAHINYNRSLITYENGYPLPKSYVAETLGITNAQANRAFRTLRRVGLIKFSYNKSKAKYFLNPYVFYRGNYIEKEVLSMFNDTKWSKFAK